MDQATTVDGRRSELGRLVHLHRVVYEVRPAVVVTAGAMRTVGFDVTLAGTFEDHLADRPTPGCEQCARIWDDLACIAREVIPKEERASSYELRPFDGSWHLAPSRRLRNDIELVLEIRHKEGYFGPPDACEAMCLDQILAGLRSLGVHEGSWHG